MKSWDKQIQTSRPQVCSNLISALILVKFILLSKDTTLEHAARSDSVSFFILEFL